MWYSDRARIIFAVPNFAYTAYYNMVVFTNRLHSASTQRFSRNMIFLSFWFAGALTKANMHYIAHSFAND